jgi:hypothetical protein|tara:strand:- start:259 stop:420 length:162 start_codon:yes stop_codon:yes gene_type:complete
MPSTKRKKFKPLWIDEEIHSQILTLADVKKRKISSVVEEFLTIQLKQEIDKNG